ncbi:MFS transporter [Geobacter sp. SVR]|uniref:MFS transporter n=1 Tax=Geobacter sp. SVR TaxID=2495594 RepID=UPI00143F015B|nr:MFS transporter [Geobacter sp. SVR]BCS55375.1 MFS transporter [Geobacter sp. SVR]GCF87298.1 MFS transporter [Geobacter sp. SVR]
MDKSTGSRLHYAWVVAGVTFLTLLVTAGIRSTPGVLIVPIEHEFGWSRATISVAISLNLLLYGLMGPFAAAFFDKFGVRRTMTMALLLLTIGVCATTFITRPWHMILIWGVVVGCGAGMTAYSLSATVVSRWFHTSQGTVLGVLTASTATGQLLFLPFLAQLAHHHGWRQAAFAIACAALAILPLVACFMRNHPRDKGLLAYGETPGDDIASDTSAVQRSNPFQVAIQGLRRGLVSRDFWLLAGSFFICGASTNGLIGTHLIPACVDHGITEVRAAGLLALMGILDLFGTTFSGWLSDRYNSRYLLCCYYGLRGLSLLGLPQALAGPEWGLSAFAIFYGLDWIATVPPTVKLTAEAFGRASVGIMFGWIFASHQIGAALAATFAGSVRTYLGDYMIAFLLSGLICLLAAGLVLRINRQPAPAAETVAGAEEPAS